MVALRLARSSACRGGLDADADQLSGEDLRGQQAVRSEADQSAHGRTQPGGRPAKRSPAWQRVKVDHTAACRFRQMCFRHSLTVESSFSRIRQCLLFQQAAERQLLI
jgi:hypothetical protein